MIEMPDVAQRRVDRKTCPSCEASVTGCRSLEVLSGRRCCISCTRDHDTTEPTTHNEGTSA